MKVRLLTEDEVFGKNKLGIIKQKGTKAKATEFAKTTGVFVDDEGYLMTSYNGYVRAVYSNGKLNSSTTVRRGIGIRPVLEFSSIDEIFKYGGEILDNNKLKFGVYAHSFALEYIEQIKWSDRLDSGVLEVYDGYTLDGANYNDYNSKFNPTRVATYEYNGKRVTRIKANSSFDGKPFMLSNGQSYKDGDYVWFEVKDVMWDFDKERLIAVYEDVTLGGLQFSNVKNNYYYDDEYFYEVDIGKYLNNLFLPELLQFKNITLDNKEEDSNLDEVRRLLCQLENNKKHIKFLEEENAKYKKLLDEVNNNLSAITEKIDGISSLKLQ